MKSKNLFLVATLIAVFVFVRLIHLDADAPAFKLMSFASIDEFYYSMCAFNLFHFGTFTNTTIPLTDMDATPLVLLLNFFQAITLKVFGNNYFGLRFGSGLCSLAIFLLLINCIKRASVLWNNPLEESRKSTSFYLVIILLLFFALDYSFLIASRISEPGISRSLILVFLIWFFTSNEKMEKHRPLLFSFILGFIALFSVCFVYLYNLFFVGAAGLALLLISYKKGKSFYSILLSTSFFILGGLVCCLIYEGFIQFFYQKSFLDYMGTITHVSDTRVSATSNGVFGVFKKIKQLFIVDFGTNIFRLNLAFLLLTLLSLPIYFYRTFKAKRNIDIFVCCLMVFWFAQSFFENSYPLKRHTLMFPVFVLILVFSLEEISHFVKYITNNHLRKIAYSIYSLAVLYLVFEVALSFHKIRGKDFPELNFFELINLASCLGTILLLLFGIWYKKLNLKLMIFSSIVLIIPPCYLLVDKIIINSTYKYKQAMIDIGQKTGDNIMVGGCSFGFRLYNSTKPVLNVYMYVYHDKPEFKKRMIELLKIGNYTILCPNFKKSETEKSSISPLEMDYLKEIFRESGFSFKMVKLYDIGDRSVVLIEKIQKGP